MRSILVLGILVFLASTGFEAVTAGRGLRPMFCTKQHLLKILLHIIIIKDY